MVEIFLLILSIVLLLIVCAIGGALFLVFIGNLLADAPFLPVPQKIANRVAELAYLPEGSVFYDLGSGDGRVVRAVAKAHLETACIGVEKAPLPVLLAFLITSRRAFPNVRFIRQDFREVTLTGGTCVFLYLFPEAMRALAPKLTTELSRGARIISCDFTFTDRTPTAAEKIHAGRRWHTLYTYQV